jgi:hypothetical protein
MRINFIIARSGINVRVTVKRLVPFEIEKNKFSCSDSIFCIDGEFKNPTKCMGNFDLSDTTGYPSYYSFSAAGTWESE